MGRWHPTPVVPTLSDMEHEQDVSQPGTRRFRIWVQGRLDPGFTDGLAGIEQEDLPAGTMLTGAVLDRSQVNGTLDLLRSLGIDVVRFEVDPPRESAEGDDARVAASPRTAAADNRHEEEDT